MKLQTIKLSAAQHVCLVEALRRWRRFHPRARLEYAWTGLGSPSLYKAVFRAGLMEPVFPIRPRVSGWWRVTPLGARIVRQWYRAGFGFEELESGAVPPALVRIRAELVAVPS